MMRIQSSTSGIINAQERLRGHHQGVPRDENTALKKQDFVCVRLLHQLPRMIKITSYLKPSVDEPPGKVVLVPGTTVATYRYRYRGQWSVESRP